MSRISHQLSSPNSGLVRAQFFPFVLREPSFGPGAPVSGVDLHGFDGVLDVDVTLDLGSSSSDITDELRKN